MVRATTTTTNQRSLRLFSMTPSLSCLLVCLFLAHCCVIVEAFVASLPPSAPLVTAPPATTTTTEPPHHHHIPSRLLGKKNGRSSSSSDPWAHNRARTDVRNFLTQRAMQSFVFLLGNCRDQATVRWLETTYDFHNLEAYHGTAAFNLTTYPQWDDMLMDMLTRPSSVIVIRARRRGRGHGGWSKNNPYLEERFVEYEIDIEPPSLVSRIVSVREQIAGEWVRDLQTLRDVNEMILDEYYKAQDELRSTSPKQKKDGDEGDEKDTAEKPSDDDDDRDTVPDRSSTINASEQKAYDRGAMMVLGNHILSDGGTASSPYRKGSFDLLGLLATQESIHRVLREYREEERGISFVWLRDFYFARLASHFDGAQPYGRADDFLGELLLQAPSMKQMDGEGGADASVIGLIDPHRIAEDIITMRSVVAQEWRDTITEVLRTDHAELRKSILTVQMDRRMDETSQYVEEQTSFYEQGFQ